MEWSHKIRRLTDESDRGTDYAAIAGDKDEHTAYGIKYKLLKKVYIK